MASSVTIVPSLGFGALYLQTGPSSGYDAIDDRRKSHPFVASEGVVAAGAYKVTQRAAGPNLSVDVAANVAAANGASALVQGDAVTSQGLYTVVAHTAVINVDIAAANATNPRNDLVVLEVLDDAHDVSGSNLTRVRVITGTATSGAAMTDAYGVNGTPALPSSCLPLAVVNIPATDTTIADAQINDRRTRATNSPAIYGAGYGGKSIISTSEARTNAAYGLLTTPDRVSGVVLPTDGLIVVAFHALWSESVINTGKAAIFLGANQIKQAQGSGAPAVQEGAAFNRTAVSRFAPLSTYPQGLHTPTNDPTSSATSAVTTGQLVGHTNNASGDEAGAGVAYIFAAAGTYDVSVQFKSSSGTVTVKERQLWVWTQAFA